MTLRERLQILIDAYEDTDHSAIHVLTRIERVLTETADLEQHCECCSARDDQRSSKADAEQSRLADIGRLVEGMLPTENVVKICRYDGDQYSASTYRDDGRLGYEKIIGQGNSVLDALRQLNEKVKGE